MMTFNFSILALDQIVNSAAKMCYMSGGQYNIPLVIRGPGGPAAQLAAQHSQSMETYFYHVPGLKVVRPSTPADAKGLLKSAIRDDNPVIFIEAETLYAVKGEVPEDPDFLIPLGKAVIRREGTDVTVVAYMGMMYRALEVAEELAKDGISVEIVDPRTLRPMDTETIIGSVRKTHRAVVLEAGAGFAGMGSEIAAQITETAFDDLDAPVAARHRRERADAVREEPRAAQDAVEGQDRGRDPRRCATHDHQGVHAEAVRRHGDRQGHQVAQEGRRRDQGRRRPRWRSRPTRPTSRSRPSAPACSARSWWRRAGRCRWAR